MNSEIKIRFGVLGCSRVAKKSVLPALIDSQFGEPVIIGSRNLKDARITAEKYHCTCGSYDEVLNSKDIDAVYISLPNALHEEWVIKAAEAGKHVWCEKPAALTYKSAKKMVEAARENNVRLFEGFMFLSHPQHKKVRDLIESGALGKLMTFEGCFAYPSPSKDSNLFNGELGGGSYNDSAVYPICASRMIFGDEPISAVCHLSVDPETKVDVKSDMLISYPKGKAAFISSAFGSQFRSTYSILGSSAHVAMERAYAVPKDKATKIFLNSGDSETIISVEAADQFLIMIDDFCRNIILGDKSTKHYEEDLLAQARVLDAGRRSHLEKRIVQLREII